MSGYGRHFRPALKNSVDIQLQTAFNEGLWLSVVRLAAQRYKTKKDPYYEAIRICAQSQMDTVVERSAVTMAVDALVRDKTAVPDIDSVELYEWALQGTLFPSDFSQTLGTLRARWAKANPASPAVVDCLKACVVAWDLVNAQQIAATLDKAQPGKHEGKTLFWSITLTQLLSTSPQCPENMSAVFGKLARMQLEKAANATTSATNGKASVRGLREEEEINLYYQIIGKDAYLKSITDKASEISVFKQFDQGRKHLLTESLKALEEAGDWDNVYDLCHHALSRKDEEGRPSFLAFDMRIWKLFVKAASEKPDAETAFTEAATILDKFVSSKSTVAPMYKKNIGLVTLELAFQHSSSSLSSVTGSDKPSPRVITLYLVIEQNLFQRATFDDVKEYVGQLSFNEAKYFIDNFSKTLLVKDSDKQRILLVRVLEIKFRYLLTTSPVTLEHVVVVGEAEEPRLKCKFCSILTDRSCKACLESIAIAALSAYKDVGTSPEQVKGLDKDPRIDLTLVASSVLLKLSGLRPTREAGRLPRLSNIDVSKLLQTVVILASQLTKTPNEVPLRLLLVQAYILLGCASLAWQTWQPLDVKRTIQDALSPLFFDRISTISPALFQQSRPPLMEPLFSYYFGCVRDDSPVRIWDAFKAGSYTSILKMADFSDRLRRSCTLAMTVVEERRGTRAYGGKLEWALDDSPLLDHITEETTFVNAIDHGSFPSLESTHAPPLYELVKLGPELSSERCRLALLAEQFVDAVAYKPPKDYKPSKANDVAVKDRAYLAETFARLHESLSTLLLGARDIQAKLTGAEHKYYTTMSLLAALLHTGLETPKAAPAPPGLSAATTGIRSSLAALRTDFASVSPRMAALESGGVLGSLTNPHGLSLLRDAAVAARQSAALVLAVQASEQARDRSGRSSLHKEVVAEAKRVDELAAEVLGEVGDRVKELKEALGQGGWLDRVEGWMFPEKEEADKVGELVRDVVGAAEVEEWAGKVVESWREGMKGFGLAKLG